MSMPLKLNDLTQRQIELTALTETGERLPFDDVAIHAIIVKSNEFLSVLFDVHHPMLGNAIDATKQGLISNFPTYNALTIQNILRRDYLWQDNCFECFISADNQAGNCYLEVNLATNGEFNLYLFDSYRMPDSMPPRALPQSKLQFGKEMNFFSQPVGCQRIFWHNASKQMLEFCKMVDTKHPLTHFTSRTGMVFYRPSLDKIINSRGNYGINPCCVMKNNVIADNTDTLLSYWAYQHLSPPDFHDKQYWLNV